MANYKECRPTPPQSFLSLKAALSESSAALEESSASKIPQQEWPDSSVLEEPDRNSPVADSSVREEEPDRNSVAELPAFELLWQTKKQTRLLDPGPPFFGEFRRGLFDPDPRLLGTHENQEPQIRNSWQGQFFPKVDWERGIVDLGLKYVPIIYKETSHVYDAVWDRHFSTYRLYGERISEEESVHAAQYCPRNFIPRLHFTPTRITVRGLKIYIPDSRIRR